MFSSSRNFWIPYFSNIPSPRERLFLYSIWLSIFYTNYIPAWHYFYHLIPWNFLVTSSFPLPDVKDISFTIAATDLYFACIIVLEEKSTLRFKMRCPSIRMSVFEDLLSSVSYKIGHNYIAKTPVIMCRKVHWSLVIDQLQYQKKAMYLAFNDHFHSGISNQCLFWTFISSQFVSHTEHNYFQVWITKCFENTFPSSGKLYR